MTDITPLVETCSHSTLADLYARAFERRTRQLDASLRIRLRRTRAVMVRSRPAISINNRTIPTSVETIFEQVRPSIWKFRSQMIDIEEPASEAERQHIRQWSCDRQRAFVSPTNRPQIDSVLDTLSAVLDGGREGRDYILLSRVPSLISH